MLNEYNILVVPGTAFGDSGEGYIRVSYAAMSNTSSLFYGKMNIAHKEPPVDKCRNYILHQD